MNLSETKDMTRGHLRLVVVACTIFALLLLPGCGFKRQLVAISIIPDTVNIIGPGISVQFKAIGTYIHPPDSRDITTSVAWQSAAPQIVSITSGGLATSGVVCGTNITITATGHSDPHDSSSGIIVGTAAASVLQIPSTNVC
jgi:hypothetical protein